MTFKVGDRVRFDEFQKQMPGTGTVMYYSKDSYYVGIEIDPEFRQSKNHHLNGTLSTKTGWWFPPTYLSRLHVPYTATQVGDRDDDI